MTLDSILRFVDASTPYVAALSLDSSALMMWIAWRPRRRASRGGGR